MAGEQLFGHEQLDHFFGFERRFQFPLPFDDEGAGLVPLGPLAQPDQRLDPGICRAFDLCHRSEYATAPSSVQPGFMRPASSRAALPSEWWWVDGV